LEYIYNKLKDNNRLFSTFFTEKTQSKGKLRDTISGNQDIKEVWVLGGDGTLNYSINELIEHNLTCSIVSGGTGNDSVKSLHGITDFKEQVEIALSGEVKEFDLGKCNDDYFVNGVGIGFDGRVVERMISKGSTKKSHLDYLITVVKTLTGYREKNIQYSIDNENFSHRLLLLTISNGTTFGGGFVINPFAKTDDGLLDICTIDAISVLGRFRHLPKLKDGSHSTLSIANFHQAKSIKVKENSELAAHMDGEFIGCPPFNIRISDQKLSLRIPTEN
jgi:YegS/Rv2252/BmrU family lipid kinase